MPILPMVTSRNHLYNSGVSTKLGAIQPELQFKIVSMLYKENDFNLAARTLEILAQDKHASNEAREKSMFLAERILDKMGLVEAAQGYYNLFVEKYPHSDKAHTANMRASQIAYSGEFDQRN